jgi:hypothetical protein
MTERSIDFRFAPKTSWTAICRPDDPHKTLVREDGALLYELRSDRMAWGFRRTIAFAARIIEQPLEIRQWTERPDLPVVHTLLRYPSVELHLRAVAHTDIEGRRFDIVAWRMTVDERRDELLAQLLVAPMERSTFFTGPTDATSQIIFAVPDDLAQIRTINPESLLAGSLFDHGAPPFAGPLAFVSIPQPLEPVPSPGFDPYPALATPAVRLEGGARERGAIVVPLDHNHAKAIDDDWVEAAFAGDRAFWTGLELLRLPMQIPDAGVMAMLEACARNILQARELIDGAYEFRVGSAVFRGLWVVDGHFLLEAAQYLGLPDAAASGVEALLRRTRADGAITEMPFHIKETAIALATLVRQAELSGDERLLLDNWPRVVSAVDYLEGLRAEAYALPPDDPAHGLLPPAFPDGGIGGMRAEFTSALWVLAGLKSIAGAAERLGKREDANRFRLLYDGLMFDFRKHASRSMQELDDGTPYLPMAKPETGRHTWLADFEGEPPPWRVIWPQTGTWALAQAIYPGEVFATDDPLVTNFLHLLDQVDDRQGVPENTAFFTYRMIWTYSTSFYAHAWLYAGRPDKAIDYLYAFANHAAPTRVWREEQPQNDSPVRTVSGDMPHNWASAEFIRLVRHMLVLERGTELELCAAVPKEWIVPGHPLRIARTPTRFGPVSLELGVSERGELTVRYRRDGEGFPAPSAVVVHPPEGFGEWAKGKVFLDPAQDAATAEFRRPA